MWNGIGQGMRRHLARDFPQPVDAIVVNKFVKSVVGLVLIGGVHGGAPN